jgi:HEAT repeat protein
MNHMGPFADGWSEADVEAVLARGEPSELLFVPIVVGMNADQCEREWAEGVCFQLARHPDFNVRGNAILGLGHIARICRALNTGVAVPLILQALDDPNEYVRGHAVSTASDLLTYLNVRITEPGPTQG